jgi:hypothetical protein
MVRRNCFRGFLNIPDPVGKVLGAGSEQVISDVGS